MKKGKAEGVRFDSYMRPVPSPEDIFFVHLQTSTIGASLFKSFVLLAIDRLQHGYLRRREGQGRRS
jgi:hypothetical protein